MRRSWSDSLLAFGDRAKRAVPVIGHLYRQRDALRTYVGHLEAELRQALNEIGRLRSHDVSRLNGEVEQARHKIAHLHALLGVGSNLSPELKESFLAFLGLVRPMAAVGREKIRIGALADGGYVMLDDFSGISHALSAGVGGNVDWDVAMGDRGMKVIQLDPTVAGPPRPHAAFSFRRLALAPQSRNGEATTLHDIVADIEGDIIGKIDIEGDEWDILASVAEEDIRRFRQVTIEFHWMASFVDPAWRERAIKAVERLHRSHQSVHIHGNNFRSMALIAGIPFPEVFEVTFARRDPYRFEADSSIYPTRHDASNRQGLADFRLGRFGTDG